MQGLDSWCGQLGSPDAYPLPCHAAVVQVGEYQGAYKVRSMHTAQPLQLCLLKQLQPAIQQCGISCSSSQRLLHQQLRLHGAAMPSEIQQLIVRVE